MALPTSGNISLTQIAAEFGGAAPHSLSEYLGAGGAPSGYPISLTDFYGRFDGYEGTMVAATRDYTVKDIKGNPIGAGTLRGFISSSLGSLSPSALGYISNVEVFSLYTDTHSDWNTTGPALILQLSNTGGLFQPPFAERFSSVTVPGIGTFSRSTGSTNTTFPWMAWGITSSQAAAITSGTVIITP